MRVGHRHLEDCDFLHTGDDGLIDEFAVMVRPLSAALALAEAMKAQLDAAGAGHPGWPGARGALVEPEDDRAVGRPQHADEPEAGRDVWRRVPPAPADLDSPDPVGAALPRYQDRQRDAGPVQVPRGSAGSRQSDVAQVPEYLWVGEIPGRDAVARIDDRVSRPLLGGQHARGRAHASPRNPYAQLTGPGQRHDQGQGGGPPGPPKRGQAGAGQQRDRWQAEGDVPKAVYGPDLGHGHQHEGRQ